MSAVLTLIFIALMAWFAFDGYRNGFYYGLVRLTTLLLVFLIAEPIGSTFSSAFENWELIPPVIRPYLGALVVGVVMVALGTVISHIVKKHTMKVSEEPTEEELKAIKTIRTGGMIMGMFVGMVLGLFVYVILWNIGWVAEEMYATPTDQLEDEVVQAMVTEFEKAQQPVGSDGKAVEVPWRIVDLNRIDNPVAVKMIQIKQGIEGAPVVGRMVNASNPVDNADYELVRDILALTNDPAKMHEFRNHPNLREIVNSDKIRDLLHDEEIRAHLMNSNFRGLIYNQKIADLVQDRDLVEQIKGANIRQIMEDIKAKTGN